MRTYQLTAAVLCMGLPLFAVAKAPKPFKLDGATIASVHEAMSHNRLSCVQLVDDYMVRIKTANLSMARGVPINAFVSLNPNVYQQARQLDRFFKQRGQFAGPMHCIPVVVKDNIDTVDTPSTSGSLAMLGSQPNRDAFLVNQLRRAGAIILGKGAMDEFASGMYGVSSKSGRVGNAYDPNANPGGSSAGVAAAVSANFAMVGIGTDNSGSVRIPAAFNGVYGLRPSTGLVSQSGIFPRGNIDGVAGPIARTVDDLAITLAAIASKSDKCDRKTRHLPRHSDYRSYLKVDYLKGKRIGVVRSVAGKQTFDQHNQAAMRIFDQAMQHFTNAGAKLQMITLPKFDVNRDDNMAGEVDDINAYLASFPSTRKNYSDICRSGRTQTFGGVSACLKHVHNTAPKGGKIYRQAMRMIATNRAYVLRLMKQQHLDALLMPLNAEGGPSYDLSRINTWRAALSSNSGLPAITINAGFDRHRLPVGMELIGPAVAEGPLLGMAYSYQSHAPKQHRPSVKPDAYSAQLLKMSIPELNNLFTLIGYESYNAFLCHSKTQNINPKRFGALVRSILTD